MLLDGSVLDAELSLEESLKAEFDVGQTVSVPVSMLSFLKNPEEDPWTDDGTLPAWDHDRWIA